LSKSIKVAGNYLNDECQKFIRSQYGLEIGSKTGESIKVNIGFSDVFKDMFNIMLCNPVGVCDSSTGKLQMFNCFNAT
jgi:actin-like ATPase involved in cell morphogenesis